MRNVGCTSVTPTPSRASSGRSDSNIPVTACLAATYAGRPTTGAKPATELITTTWPWLSRRAASAAWVQETEPRWLTASTCRWVSTSWSSKAPIAEMPALLTSRSIRPWSATMRSNTARTSASSVMSQPTIVPLASRSAGQAIGRSSPTTS